MSERTTNQSETADREGRNESVTSQDEIETDAVDDGVDSTDNDTPATDGGATMTETGDLEPLLADEETDDFRSRWEMVQAGFVDEPREAVQQADVLVGSLTERLAETFSQRRDGLEQQWGRGDEVSTEDLRQALRSYRSFFDRLLRA